MERISVNFADVVLVQISAKRRNKFGCISHFALHRSDEKFAFPFWARVMLNLKSKSSTRTLHQRHQPDLLMCSFDGYNLRVPKSHRRWIYYFTKKHNVFCLTSCETLSIKFVRSPVNTLYTAVVIYLVYK